MFNIVHIQQPLSIIMVPMTSHSEAGFPLVVCAVYYGWVSTGVLHKGLIICEPIWFNHLWIFIPFLSTSNVCAGPLGQVDQFNLFYSTPFGC